MTYQAVKEWVMVINDSTLISTTDILVFSIIKPSKIKCQSNFACLSKQKNKFNTEFDNNERFQLLHTTQFDRGPSWLCYTCLFCMRIGAFYCYMRGNVCRKCGASVMVVKFVFCIVYLSSKGFYIQCSFKTVV